MTEIRAENGFVILNGARLTPGEACGVAFSMSEQGDEETAKRIWQAAAEADRQAETADSSDQRWS